jgi:hypothetical protein
MNRQRRLTIKSALQLSAFVWPNFVYEHGCVFLSQHTGSNPPPPDDTATGWESFINHTHIFDEFRNSATRKKIVERLRGMEVIEETYDDTHPDFRAACELGRTAAKLWALKLRQDFPLDRFRVYYTEYDNPIVRFHKVRINEAFWLTDEGLANATDPSFRNALIYDTRSSL